MIRKLGLLVFVMLLMPAIASAANMQVTSSALPATGGSITPNGLQFFSGAANYTITVKPGWSIGSVLIDNVASPNGTAISQTVPFDTSKIHTIKVTFSQSPSLYSITTNAGPGGLLQIMGGGQTNITAGSSRTVVVAPMTGYKISSYSIDGVPQQLPANPNFAVNIPFTNIRKNYSVSAFFASIPMITVTAGGDKTIGVGSTATLSGSASSNTGAITYQWAVVTKPAGALTSFGTPTAAVTTFSADKTGLYTVTLTASSGGSAVTSSPATITVISAAQAASSSCTQCHAGIPEVTQWLSSKHATSSAGASCPSCHMPNSEAHPGLAISAMGTVCNSCHLDNSGNVANHPIEIGTNTCVSCHNPHSLAASGGGSVQGPPHFNNITGGMYPASYVTSMAACTDCHASGTANKTIRQQWAQSGHSATTALPWINYDFKTRSVCERCHTTTGFIAYSTAKVTAAWGVASDKTKEVLTCVGCHSNVAAGTVRTVTPNKPFADEQSYTNSNVGISNICMDCHTGMNNGQSIQVKVTAGANFANLSYIAPHYLTAGGSLQGKSGFHFPGRTYTNYSSNSHRQVGRMNVASTGTNGACAACHMSAPDKHYFKPVTTDQNGVITAVTTTVCTNCHTAMPTDKLNVARADFDASLDVLKAQLLDKGFVYSPNYPYFAAKNWGSGQLGANNMGAAFNYKLLLAEPGAYTHSPEYAKQLILDSIEVVFNNGDATITGSINSAITDLYGKGLITADQVAAINNFKDPAVKIPVDCYACHPILSGSHSKHIGTLTVTAYGAADTNYTANSSDNTGYKFGCAYCHPTVNANHTNGTIALSGNGVAGTTKSNITCAASSCHSNGKGVYTTSPNWYTGFTGSDRCAMCHAATPTTGSHTAHTSINGIHDGSSGITYAAVYSCTKCHASTVDSAKNINYPNHANGIVNVAFVAAQEVSKAQISAASFNAYSTVWTRTGAVDTSKNLLSAGSYSGGTCSTIACHNNGTTPAWGTAVKISCVDCHSDL